MAGVTGPGRGHPRRLDLQLEDPRTALDIRILAEPGADPSDLEQFADTLREINDEDAPINERTQAGLASRFSRPGRISHLEGANWRFRSWLMEQLDTA